MSLKMRCQQGFTTVTLMGVLMAGGLMVAAGFAAVDPDTSLSKRDHDFKQSYAAAEAGLNYYLYHLGQDNNLYLRCENVPPPNGTEFNPITQVWTGSTNNWRKLPGEKAEYNIELLPARSYPACVQNRQETMIDPATGSFRIRANGRVPKAGGGYVKRSVIATLRRKSFIDFLYFTNFETADPYTYATPALQAWADQDTTCRTFRQTRHANCTVIQFADSDVIAGPFHTNDDIITCGRPTFGRTRNDAIELGGRSPGWANRCGTSSPNFLGTRVWPGGTLPMPPTNKELQTIADPAYRFNGTTVIELQGTSLRVTNGGTTRTVAPPANGVIYVGSLGCPGGYSRKQEYRSPSTCGDVWVKGNYSQDLTIAAANDIIVYDDVTRDSPGLLMGLVADNFVRVYHPVRNWRNSNADCTNTESWRPEGKYNGYNNPFSITIQSAILALKHSFIVDNYYCGDNDLGTLTVDGAIGQMYRGPVGTGSGGTIVHGYEKNYIYNDRLRYREPPFFIDPVQSAWQIVRQNEQIPAH